MHHCSKYLWPDSVPGGLSESGLKEYVYQMHFDPKYGRLDPCNEYQHVLNLTPFVQ